MGTRTYCDFTFQDTPCDSTDIVAHIQVMYAAGSLRQSMADFDSCLPHLSAMVEHGWHEGLAKPATIKPSHQAAPEPATFCEVRVIPVP